MIGTGAIGGKDRSACSLIDDRILVDCGNGIVKTILEQNVDINKIDTLLITHLHGDHFLDIPFLILQRNFSKTDNKLNIYCPKGSEKTIEEIFKLIYFDIKDWTILRDNANISFIEFDSLDNKEVCCGYFVDSYNVIHGDFYPAFGFVIKHNGQGIGFSGDSSYSESIDEIVKNSDVSILDMSFIESNDSHMGVHDIELLSNKYNKKIIPTHMSLGAREYAVNNKINNVIVLNDGDIIEI